VPRAIQAHLGSEQVARVIYGAIIGLAVVVGLEAHPGRPGVMAVTMIATAVAVGLAEAYSEIVGSETRRHRHVARKELRHIGIQAVAVGFGVGFPAVFFILAAVGAMDVETAFTVAKWTGLGLIGFYGFCAGRLAGATLAGALVQATAVALIGALLIALKALVH
jgi:hypothetical protein